ncbi:DUF2599 domain-containing protein [Mycobacterium simiae]|uniref:DUF2599 domain-containing protein n=1 Tax=Mycobacterium simiae TaxID=1784 RepID=A0A5B1BS69_MYCSI|nr:DUF2599 domain-containing protein [Mycobacterium simiae]KAA1251226.1 DUF2599 domain-containing protein [Mycobacterium simiae]
MKRLLVVSVAVLAAVLSAIPAAAGPDTGISTPAGPSYSPPLIDHTEWVYLGQLSSLRVFPTPTGRAASRHPGTTASADVAWAEILALSPDADIPGMRSQFDCHWELAEIAQPGKISWNLEPWRPVVDDAAMLDSGCNPGGAEEQF